MDLDAIVNQLDARKQRATYDAVAGLVGGLPRGLMAGRPKNRKDSWVVAKTGSRRGSPTGYTEDQIHPDCLRQIREGLENVIDDPEELRRWLEG